MIREIKFRALANGKWWYSDDEAYCLKEYDGVLYLCEDEHCYKNEDIPLLKKIGKAIQYTGLKDKNGVEIYEGSILKSKSRNGVVEWYWPRTAFRLYIKLETGSSGCALTDHLQKPNTAFDNLEVIGNIYENPKLLEYESK